MTTEPFDVWITRYSELGTIWHASADQVEYDTDFPDSIEIDHNGRTEFVFGSDWHRSEEAAREHASKVNLFPIDYFEIVEEP